MISMRVGRSKALPGHLNRFGHCLLIVNLVDTLLTALHPRLTYLTPVSVFLLMLFSGLDNLLRYPKHSPACDKCPGYRC